MLRWERDTGWTVGRRVDRDPAKALTGKLHPERRWRGRYPPLSGPFDHMCRIRRAGGRRGVLTMPYGLDFDQGAELDEWCAPLDATWRTSDAPSWWHPWTVAIVITREPQPPGTSQWRDRRGAMTAQTR